MSLNKAYSLGELAERLSLRLIGDAERRVTGLGTLKGAGPEQLSFLSNPSYAEQLGDCKAAAVIVAEKFAERCPQAALISSSPYVSFAAASALFAPALSRDGGRHPSAVVADSAEVHASATVAAQAVIEEGVRIGADCHIGAGCYIGADSSLDEGCRLYPNVTLYHGVHLGKRVIIHSGTVLGSDGFGYAMEKGASIKIHQLGGVRIGDDVEIGAGSTVDRGAIEDTLIEEGVKIDNQVQIAHNCRVGAHSIICGNAGLAGSASIGRHCVLAGGVGISGHITLTDRVQITAMSLINKSISEPGTYSSGTTQLPTNEWKRNAVRFKQLDSIARRLKELQDRTDKK